MFKIKNKSLLSLGLVAGAVGVIGCSNTVQEKQMQAGDVVLPAMAYDLSHWKITVPLDDNKDGKVDEVDTKALQKYMHSDYFYVNSEGGLVFATPNQATTTSGSSNSRSELRQMIRGTNTRIGTKSPGNNFALASHPQAKAFGDIGGNLKATLAVNHVALNAKYTDKFPAYSVVVGQIHAGKDKDLIAKGEGYGWGNEPIKIYYKKWPDHKTGSVFWTYERNLEKANPDRTDIAYPVWGNTWDNSENPGDKGIALDESFSYEINVYKDIMHLTFTAANKPTVKYSINLANNVNAYGKVDEKDHPKGYLGDWLYFKAGAYDQCSVKDDPGFWYPACAGTGDWETDKKNGDYTRVTFTKLELGKGYSVSK
ncbi:polysaccharide lyase family 7 protein [Saccharophagus degradans]|uniref:Putative polysaccharide lyase n=1 Tax=Saccharophagus degradans (strain 2-40 / ATCC 43961 / DSM 17024) TaxID=203122 RepID=Q21GT3_SACD2|nr:polysaccharide lyase family 7 protein [Saccharophagus degradans]ABD82096.1 putative polysaccharide lyase [Saccharophagus degradans 2-40]